MTRLLVIPARAASERLDQVLAAILPGASRRRVRVAITAGEVVVNRQRVAVCSRGVHPGDLIEVPESLGPLPPLPELPLLAESDDWAAFAKPPGLLSEPSVSTDVAGAVATGLELARRAFVLAGTERAFAACVGRLDRPVSGLLLVAKSGPAHGSLVRALRRDDAGKHYLALTDGIPADAAGEIDHPIRRAGVVHFTIAPGDGARAARSRYRVLARAERTALVAIRLLTGRTHQARLHLAAVGAPVAGDTRYGLPDADGRRDPEVPTPRIFLHAHRLDFRFGDASRSLIAPLPDDFRAEATRRGIELPDEIETA